jgi:hypothetical protein
MSHSLLLQILIQTCQEQSNNQCKVQLHTADLHPTSAPHVIELELGWKNLEREKQAMVTNFVA